MTFCGHQARQSTLNFDALRIGGHKIDTQSDFRTYSKSWVAYDTCLVCKTVPLWWKPPLVSTFKWYQPPIKFQPLALN